MSQNTYFKVRLALKHNEKRARQTVKHGDMYEDSQADVQDDRNYLIMNYAIKCSLFNRDDWWYF